MIKETAQVVRQTDGHVWLQVQRQSSCGKCSLSGGCGTSILANYFNRHPQLIKLTNSAELNVGQQVVLGMEEGAMLRGSILVYLLPLLSMLLFAIVGQYIGEVLQMNAEFSSLILAVVGLYLASLWVGKHINRSSKAPKIFQPKILRKL